MSDKPDLILRKGDGGFVEVRGGSLPHAVLAVIEGRAIIVSREGVLYDDAEGDERSCATCGAILASGPQPAATYETDALNQSSSRETK